MIALTDSDRKRGGSVLCREAEWGLRAAAGQPPTIHAIADRTRSGNRLFIMREDLLPYSLGGNKVRIAAAFFEDADARGCDVMIAYGNARSNLCRVIANECHRRGMPCYVVLTAEDTDAQDARHAETNNSRLMRLLGATMVPTAKSGIADTVSGLLGDLRAAGRTPYYIYGNELGVGNEGVAASAYAKVYPRIADWQREAGVRLDYVFVASGTGSTQAGLTCGHILAGDDARIVGILVSSRTRQRHLSIVEAGVRDYLESVGRPFGAAEAGEIVLASEYTHGGYGVYDDEVLRCVREHFLLNGLPLDPTYTGKALLGMEQHLRDRGITGANALFVHTGGHPLFYDCLAQTGLV